MRNSSFGDSKKTFAEKTISILKKRNISFVALAKEVGENVNTVKNSLYGRRHIREDLARKICKFLDVDYYEMIKDDEYLNSLNPNVPLSFGKKLENILISKNIYKSDFADSLGLSNATITNIIQDKTDIKKDTLINICNLLNVDIYEMIKDDPKYISIKDNLNNKISISTVFQRVGITKPVSGYEDILTDLINKNRDLFTENKSDEKNLNNTTSFLDKEKEIT